MRFQREIEKQLRPYKLENGGNIILMRSSLSDKEMDRTFPFMNVVPDVVCGPESDSCRGGYRGCSGPIRRLHPSG